MKRSVRIIAVLVLVVVIGVTAVACNISYGDPFASMEALKEKLSAEGLNMMYPSIEENDQYDRSYIASYDYESEKYVGYKVYYMYSPFYISVYSYSTPSDKPLSDNAENLTMEETLKTAKGDAVLYSGKTKEDNLYLLAMMVIDGVQYEVRVINDKTMKDGKFVNAITKDNGNYDKAKDTIVKVIDSLAY